MAPPASSSDAILNSPAWAQSFPGLVDSSVSFQYQPADTSGAVGHNYLMVTTSSHVRYQLKNGGVLRTDTLSAFWTGPRTGVADDARVVYEPVARRWITVASDDWGDPADGGILLGFSEDENPSLTWRRDKKTTNGLWLNRPTIGFNKNWVVIQANLYSSGGFVGSRVWVFDRVDFFGFLDGSFTPVLTQDLPGQLAVVPAVTYDDAAGPEDLFFLQTANPATGDLRLWKLTRPGGPGSEAIVQVGLVSGPGPWSDAAPTANFAPQMQFGCPAGTPPCGPECRIHVGDSRIQSVVARNGKIWASQTVLLQTPDRSAVQWWEIDPDPAPPTVLQTGLVEDPAGTRHFAYPSLAVNENEDVLLGYSRFQGDEFAGASYSFRTSLDPPGAMQAERTFKDGTDCYFKDPAAVGENRWGPYSATVVDPADKTLWTIQEYAADHSTFDRWGTWWAQLDPSPKIVITDAWVSETAPPGTTRLVFDVSLMNFDLSGPLPTSQPVSVAWQTTEILGEATDGTDYVGGGGVLEFAPGETVKRIEVTVVGDTIPEDAAGETLYVDLSTAANATVAVDRATGTILDLPPPQVAVNDVRKVEGDGGFNGTQFAFQVTLSYPADVQVAWSTGTILGGATAGPLPGGDFSASFANTLTFTPPVATQTIVVLVHGDDVTESEEAFSVNLSVVSGPATLARGQGIGRIVDDDASFPPVAGLSILSDSTAAGSSNGRNRLQWVNPPSVDTAFASVLIKYNVSATSASSCAAPANPADVASGIIDIPGPVSAGKTVYTHAPLQVGFQYCYSAWVDYGGGAYSPRASLAARPYDSHEAENKVLWKLATFASLMPAPTVGADAVVAVSNDTHVHALERDPASATAGLWPSAWNPLGLGSLAHHRVPVVPRGASNAAFITTEDGRVHSVDTRTGDLLWSTELPEKAARAAPAGIFVAGGFDYVLVGTSNASLPDHFYALDPDTGAVVDVFPGPNDTGLTGDLGEVFGMATVDYAAGRVYFGSYRGSAQRSLWCLELGPPSDALRLRWSRDLGVGSDVEGSPVLRGGRLYVGDQTGLVWSIPASTGTGGHSRSVGPSPVKGFLFPDRTGRDLYAATDTGVVGLTDDGAGILLEKWAPIALDAPSIVLLRPGTSELYVGVRSYPAPTAPASLLRIDAATGTVASSVPLETGPQVVGAPSLDIEHEVIHVGSEAGVLYAVQLSF